MTTVLLLVVPMFGWLIAGIPGLVTGGMLWFILNFVFDKRQDARLRGMVGVDLPNGENRKQSDAARDRQI
jgi:hypothetical protein